MVSKSQTTLRPYDCVRCLHVKLSSNRIFKAWSALGKHRNRQPANNVDVGYYLGSTYLSGNKLTSQGRVCKYAFLDYTCDYWLLHSIDFIEVGKASRCCTYEVVDSRTWHLWKDFLVTDHFLARKPWTAKEWSEGSRTISHWIASCDHPSLLGLGIASALNAARLGFMIHEIAEISELFLLTTLHEVSLPEDDLSHDIILWNMQLPLIESIETGDIRSLKKFLKRFVTYLSENPSSQPEHRLALTDALRVAISKDYWRMVEVRMEKGANVKDNLDYLHLTTILVMAYSIKNGHQRVVQLMLTNLLTGHAFDPALHSISFGIALNIAAKEGQLGSVGFLLEHGADISYVDLDGRLLLDNARKERQEAVEKLLLEKGAYTGITIKRLKHTMPGSIDELYLKGGEHKGWT